VIWAEPTPVFTVGSHEAFFENFAMLWSGGIDNLLCSK